MIAKVRENMQEHTRSLEAQNWYIIALLYSIVKVSHMAKPRVRVEKYCKMRQKGEWYLGTYQVH